MSQLAGYTETYIKTLNLIYKIIKLKTWNQFSNTPHYLFVVLFCVLAELLFLLWGVYLCYAVRTVPSAFHEPRYMAVAIYNELLISAIFHIIRWVRNVVVVTCADQREEREKKI